MGIRPIKPVLDPILTFTGYGAYMMQSDKGEFVIGDRLTRTFVWPVIFFDHRTGHGRDGMFPVFKRVADATLGWHVDIVYDGCPIISRRRSTDLPLTLRVLVAQDNAHGCAHARLADCQRRAA